MDPFCTDSPAQRGMVQCTCQAIVPESQMVRCTQCHRPACKDCMQLVEGEWFCRGNKCLIERYGDRIRAIENDMRIEIECCRRKVAELKKEE